MKKKNIIYKILLIIGIIPFVFLLGGGIFFSITGFSGICFWNCNYYYGFQAFRDGILFLLLVFWPAYIIGIILIILSIHKLRKMKQIQDNK